MRRTRYGCQKLKAVKAGTCGVMKIYPLPTEAAAERRGTLYHTIIQKRYLLQPYEKHARDLKTPSSIFHEIEFNQNPLLLMRIYVVNRYANGDGMIRCQQLGNDFYLYRGPQKSCLGVECEYGGQWSE